MKKRFTKILLLCLMVSLLTSIVSASYPCPTGDCLGRIFEHKDAILVSEEWVPCTEGADGRDLKQVWHYVYTWECTQCDWSESNEEYGYTLYICNHLN